VKAQKEPQYIPGKDEIDGSSPISTIRSGTGHVGGKLMTKWRNDLSTIS
jgi:hypothetical protein